MKRKSLLLYTRSFSIALCALAVAGCFLSGSAWAADDAVPASPVPGAGASPVPTPAPVATLPKPMPETEDTNVDATQAPNATLEQAPQSAAQDAAPGDEAQREGLLQPESGLDQQLSEGQAAAQQPLFNKPKPLSTRQYEFDLGVSEIFDDNIFLSSGHKDSDFITTLSPTVKLQLGDFADQEQSFLVVGYTPSFIIFADHSREDAIDSDAHLVGQWTPSKLTLGVDFRFQHLSGSEIEIAERVRRNLYTGALTGKWDVNEKISLEADFYEQTLDYGSSFVSSNEWTNRDWFNFKYTPSFTLSAGAAFGYVTVSDSTDQYYEQLLVRGMYTAAAKLAFTGNVGIEYRQFGDRDIDSKLTPVFSLGFVYKPYQETEITFDGFRRVEYSALFVGDNYTETGVDFTLSQRLTSRFLILGEAGYAYSDYQTTRSSLFSIGAYSFVYVKPEISYEFTSWFKSDLFYEFRDKTSQKRGLGFTDNQIGLEANFTF